MPANTTGMIFSLMKKVKDLTARVEELEKRIKALEDPTPPASDEREE